jgi:nucleoside-diphosphate-sugar epimerase
VRIVITGGSGNAGTAVLSALGPGGRHELVGISRRRPPEVAPYSTAEWVCVDIAEPDATSRLAAVFAGADAVIHLAWLIRPSHDREALRRTNQDGTAAVVAAAIAAGVPHLVHQSSVGTYAASTGQTVDETWPTTGIPTLGYSVDKAAAERIVDRAEDHMVVTRVRPALNFQDAAASEISRYFLGPLVPNLLVRRSLVRFAPFPDALAFQLVHADDLAAALKLIVETQAGGAFNVAADPVIDRVTFRQIFGGVGPSLPPRILRAAAAATWRARIQPTEPGWIDLAATAPRMDTTRLRSLGWAPSRDARDVLGDFVDAISRSAGHRGPLLHRP